MTERCANSNNRAESKMCKCHKLLCCYSRSQNDEIHVTGLLFFFFLNKIKIEVCTFIGFCKTIFFKFKTLLFVHLRWCVHTLFFFSTFTRVVASRCIEESIFIANNEFHLCDFSPTFLTCNLRKKP